MARGQETQRQRTQNNPLVLGTFETTTLKYLKGKLGPANQLVGRADTGQQSNGGYGGGNYNHWFQVNLKTPAWIIVAKSGPRPNYIQTSVYDLNRAPIEGRSIFQADSVQTDEGPQTYYPYLSTVMGAQSDLYNTFSQWRLDRGDERYFPLESGQYLLCVSTTRNEPLDYEVGLVVEFPITEMFIALEDEDAIGYLLQETAIDFSRTVNVENVLSVNTTISSDVDRPNGFTDSICTINSGVTVTILDGSEWLIGELISEQDDGFKIPVDVGDASYFDTIHDHSLSEWQESWEATHQDTDKFPEVFTLYTNRL